MKKINLFIITALIAIICAAFAVSAEESEQPTDETAVTTAVTELIPEETSETTTTLITTIPQGEVTTEEVTTTVPVTTEPIVTTTNDEGLCVDTALMKKYYFSENTTFDSSGISVTYNGIDVTDKSEITFKETPSIYNGESFDYEISFDVNFSMETEDGTIGEYKTFYTDVKIGRQGDADQDHKIELYDTIEIARKFMPKNENKYASVPVSDTFEDFMMNTNSDDSVIDLYDAIWSAKLYMTLNPPPKVERPQTIKKPNIKKYDTSTMAGIKKYANDCIIYQARIYGIPEEHIYFDDSVDVWQYSWDAPPTFISDMDYYISQEKYQPLFYWTNTEAGIKSLGYDLMYCVQAAVREWKMNFEEQRDKYGSDTWEDIIARRYFTIKWENLGHNNYEVYVMWGGPMRN